MPEAGRTVSSKSTRTARGTVATTARSAGTVRTRFACAAAAAGTQSATKMDNPRMRRAVIAAPIVAALVLAPIAEAHITVTPTVAPPGSDQVLTFTVPNEREHGAITGVLIGNGGLSVEAVGQKA